MSARQQAGSRKFERAGPCRPRARPGRVSRRFKEDTWLPKPALEGADSGIYRRFSGSKAFDFPAQDGPFPVRQWLEGRHAPAFDRKFRSKAERDNTRQHKCRIPFIMIEGIKAFQRLARTSIDDKIPLIMIKIPFFMIGNQRERDVPSL
jgi:hypothetical protein